jgi:hypothetical protein
MPSGSETADACCNDGWGGQGGRPTHSATTHSREEHGRTMLKGGQAALGWAGLLQCSLRIRVLFHIGTVSQPVHDLRLA